MSAPQFIDNPQDLAEFCQHLDSAPWLTFDTEFMREKTYYPQLCLLQVASESQVACIDPLALEDIGPLLDRLYAPNVTVVMHAARQDLEILYHLRGSLPQRVFDTQLAATVLGYGDQVGYGGLVKAMLGVELNKDQTRTDWSQRPLDPAQLDYAADDVRYLRDIYKAQLEQLNTLQRLSWLEEDFANLTRPDLYETPPDEAWLRVKGANRLKPRQLAALRTLAAWREREAVAANRPRRWILRDEALLEMARQLPPNMDRLQRIRGLEARTSQRHGKVLLACIAEAKSLSLEQCPSLETPLRLEPGQDALVDLMMAVLRALSARHSISPAAIANRRDLERLVAGDPGCPLLHGWRHALFGAPLQGLLKGEQSVHVDAGALTLEPREN